MTEQEIVLQVCEEHRISADTFFGPAKSPVAVACRADAIVRLQELGFSVAHIARVIRRHYSTVHWWTRAPHFREFKREYFRKRWECMGEAYYQRRKQRDRERNPPMMLREIYRRADKMKDRNERLDFLIRWRDQHGKKSDIYKELHAEIVRQKTGQLRKEYREDHAA